MHTLEDLINFGFQPAQDNERRVMDASQWEEGREGFRDHKDNPYPYNTRAHHCWALGFMYQRKIGREAFEQREAEAEARAQFQRESLERRKAKQARNKSNRQERGQQSRMAQRKK